MAAASMICGTGGSDEGQWLLHPVLGENPVKIGDIFEYKGLPYRITSIDPILNPYRGKDQTTRVIGYTLGLQAVVPLQEEGACDGHPRVL